MIYLTWLLRIIHIVSGVFWVGGSLMMNFFIGPAVSATAEAGQKFASYLITKTRFIAALSSAAGLTVLAGFILYALDAGAGAAWARSGFGIGLGIGALFALIGFVAGIMVGRNTRALVQTAAGIQGKPTPEQLGKIQAIQKQQSLVGPINVWSLVLAVVFMAVARYLHF